MATVLGTSQRLGHLQTDMGIVRGTCFSFMSGSTGISLGRYEDRRASIDDFRGSLARMPTTTTTAF